MDPNSSNTRRKILILVSAIDAAISGIVLLMYFGFIPVNLSGLGVPRQVIGWIAGIWFLIALAILVYQLTRTDILE
jgi:hypothetical protein